MRTRGGETRLADALLAPGWDLSPAAPRGSSPRPPDRPDLPALFPSAEELIAAIGLESRDMNSAWHIETLKNLSGARIDSPQIALVTFPGRVPQLSIDPGDPGDKAVGLDGAQNRPGIGIHLMDLSRPILADP